MFAIVVHKNIDLGDHTLNNEKLSLVNTKFLINKKMTVNLENLNLLSGLKMICLFVKVDQNVYKTANKSALIYTNQIQLLSSNWPEAESYLHDLSRVFKKNKTKFYEVKYLHFKNTSFPADNDRTSILSSF